MFIKAISLPVEKPGNFSQSVYSPQSVSKLIVDLFFPLLMLISILSILSPLAIHAASVNGGNLLFLQKNQNSTITKEHKLAEFRYYNGARVVFTYDEASQEYGLLQEGIIGESEPLIVGPVDSLLEVFLDIAPYDAAVPEMLLSEPRMGRDLSFELKSRKTSKSLVTSTQLSLPITVAASALSQSCFSTYYSWWDWHDPATAGLAPKTYYASSFGGKKRYTDSYILNCTPAGSPSYLWARHRIYYKNAFGNYKKQFEGKVSPWHWQAKHKGSSIKRYRRVIYDDNWNSSPNCLSGSCRYTREGRFHN